MSDKVYPVPAEWKQRAWVDNDKYLEMYQRSVDDPVGFWGDMGKRLDWIKPYTKVKNTSFDPHNVSIKWYEDGVLNVSANCIDRHLAKRGDQVAIIWEGDDPTQDEKITYRQLYERVNKFANVMKAHGVKKGDRVTIYLPMIPEAAYAMLACARIGAIHSIVFGGFSPDSLQNRIDDADSKFIITSDEGLRGGKTVPLKKNTDDALKKCKGDEKVLVVRRTGNPVPWTPGRDFWLHEEIVKVPAECPPEPMNAEDPLFILYTSGSTGKPKGVVHTTGGYLVYASLTHQYVFDYHEGDIYW
ncbi:MAG: AMP-binding protein, partial [Hyphomicrobiaceae bacterium]|nr:AMP-binding protein [Hyphomicrobiaceae bacterium]